MRKTLQAAPPSKRHALLEDYIYAEVARALELPPGQYIERQRGVFELGMDSLMALEMTKRIELNLDLALPTTIIFEHPTIQSLSGHLLERLQLRQQDEAAESTPAKTVSAASTHIDHIEHMSEDEALALLLEKLEMKG
jgi:myxalamid-type polyketide synthase MxaE and MxaD